MRRDGWPSGAEFDDYVDSDGDALSDDDEGDDDSTDENSSDGVAKAANGSASMAVSKHPDGKCHPASFSQIDLTASAAVLRRDYPNFPGRSKALRCIVQAGKLHVRTMSRHLPKLIGKCFQ